MKTRRKCFGLLAAVVAPLLAGAGEPGEGIVLAGASPVSADILADQRGTARIQVDRVQVNDQDLTATVNDNVAIGNETGNNTVASGAFSYSSGFMTAIQNTGNNVVIQNATIINVSVEP